jgi:hypothetical protein
MTAPLRPVPTLAAPYSAAQAADRVLAVAASQIGYREGRSGSDWNNDQAFGVWYGQPGVSWCAQFVSWCAAQAGYGAIIPRHQYTPTGWAWFVKHGRKVSTPARGDVLYVYGKTAGVTRVHHVGFVERVLPGGRIQTIEGNTDDGGGAQGRGVFRLTRTVSSRLRFARPDYAAVVVKRPPGAKPARPPDAARVKALSTKGMVYAATHPNMDGQWGAQRLAALSTLKFLKLTPSVAPPAGTPWDAHFRAAWKRWQESIGYTGKDADGIPGTASVDALCRRAGYKHLP